MQRRVLAISFILVLALAAGYIVGCSDSVKPPPPPPPLDPETELTFAPIEFDTTTFRVHFYWNGWDKDGEVVGFYFATDADSSLPITQWHSTTAKDTTLKFLVDPIQQVRKHVFLISSFDNSSHYDKTPARRTFAAKTDPPTSKIDRGPSAFNPQVGPNFTFEWSGEDPDGGETGGKAPVDSFEYVLLLLGSVAEAGHPPLPSYNERFYIDLLNAATGPTLPTDFQGYDFSDWKWIGVHELKHRYRNQTPGEYVFAERAVDIAGATERVMDFGNNIRHFTVSTRNPGPILRVSSSVLTLPLPPTSGPDDAPRKALQIFEGETVSFSWNASADAYGGEVVGYTFALDDTTLFPGLNLFATGVTYTPARLTPGNHFLYVRAVDDGGLLTNAVIPILIVHPAFKDPGTPREVLYVDDSMSPGNSLTRIQDYPSDTEESDWWSFTLLHNALPSGILFTEWDTYRVGSSDVQGRKPPEPRDLARYSTIIWNVDFNNGVSEPTGLFKTLVGGAYSELAGYLRAGGTLILTGFAIGSNVVEPRSTVYGSRSRGMCFSLEVGSPEYILSFFPRIYMGLDGAYPNDQGLRTLGAKDFIAAYPTVDGIAAGYDTVRIDRGPLGSGAKWTTYPGSGDPNLNSRPGLPQVDGWIMAQNFGCELGAAQVFRPENPGASIALPVYRYHGVNMGVLEQAGPSPREGMVVGIQMQSHSLGTSGARDYDPRASLGRMVHLAFPLYFLRDADAIRILQTAFNYVDHSPTLP